VLNEAPSFFLLKKKVDI